MQPLGKTKLPQQMCQERAYKTMSDRKLELKELVRHSVVMYGWS